MTRFPLTAAHLVCAVTCLGAAAQAQDAGATPAEPARITEREGPRLGPDSGLPVPRFVSLKFDEVNGREGPSFEHPVLWRYRRQGLPVEVIEEDLGWRKIRDPDGAEVWMHERVLENRRTGLVAGAPATILRRPDDDAAVAAVADPGVVFEIKACRGAFMRVDGPRAAGWVRQGALWGAGCG